MSPSPFAQEHGHRGAKELEKREETRARKGSGFGKEAGAHFGGGAGCSLLTASEERRGLRTPRSKDAFELLWQEGCFHLKINRHAI